LKNQKNDLYAYEKALLAKGIRYIAGVDEVGRGPLAGGVLACACILDLSIPIDGIDDSKKLSEKKRLRLSMEIEEKAISYAFGYVSEKEIDTINIYQASRKAMKKAVQALKVKPDHLLVDALSIDVDIPQTSIIKGDAHSVSIGAASILAKVKRDAMMVKFNERYPGYGFDKHKGYPTAFHLEQLKRLKPCPIHRRSYQPVIDVLIEQMQLNLGGHND